MDDSAPRLQLAVSLSEVGARVSFDKAVEGSPIELAARRAASLAHNAGRLLARLVIGQGKARAPGFDRNSQRIGQRVASRMPLGSAVRGW